MFGLYLPRTWSPQSHVLASSEALGPSSHSPPRGRPFSLPHARPASDAARSARRRGPGLPPRRAQGIRSPVLFPRRGRAVGVGRSQRQRQDDLVARAGPAGAARGWDHALARQRRAGRAGDLARPVGVARPPRRPQGRPLGARKPPGRGTSARRAGGRRSPRRRAGGVRPDGSRRAAGANTFGRPAPSRRACPCCPEPGSGLAAGRASECARCAGPACLSHRACQPSRRRRGRDRRHPRQSRHAGGAQPRAGHRRVTPVLALIARDLRLVWRRPGDVAVVLAFFVVATVLFPLGIGPEPNTLARIAAGVLWCAALFASLLSLERLFAADYEDGTLDLLLLAPGPVELAALAKCLAHWLVTGLPLAVLAPALGVAFGLEGRNLAVLALSLLVGTPALSLVGGLA